MTASGLVTLMNSLSETLRGFWNSIFRGFDPIEREPVIESTPEPSVIPVSEPKIEPVSESLDAEEPDLKNKELRLFLKKNDILGDFVSGYIHCDFCYAQISESNLAVVIGAKNPRFLCNNPECSLFYTKKKKPEQKKLPKKPKKSINKKQKCRSRNKKVKR